MSDVQRAQTLPADSEPSDIEEMKIDALSAALTEAASAVVSTSFGEIALAQAVNSGDFDIWVSATSALEVSGRRVTQLMLADDRFPKDVRFFFRSVEGNFEFYPHSIGKILIRRVIDSGSTDEAINWLLRILSTKNASGRVIEALWGVPVNEESELQDRLSILPTASLKDGPFKSLLLGHRRGIREDLTVFPLAMGQPSSVLAYRVEIADVVIAVGDVVDLSPALSSGTAKRIDEQMQDIADLLNVVGPRIALSAGISFEFDDPDLHYLASFLVGRRIRFIEVLPVLPSFTRPQLDIAEARELIALFIRIPRSDQKRIRVALNRFSLAQRRFKWGDKATDLAIALESLLGGEGNTEVTHKVTTRATRLLGGSNDERLRTRGIVSKTYGYRSKSVHQGEEPRGTEKIVDEVMPANEIIDAATLICVAVIKKIIHLGKIPTWHEFDIVESGGSEQHPASDDSQRQADSRN